MHTHTLALSAQFIILCRKDFVLKCLKNVNPVLPHCEKKHFAVVWRITLTTTRHDSDLFLTFWSVFFFFFTFYTKYASWGKTSGTFCTERIKFSKKSLSNLPPFSSLWCFPVQISRTCRAFLKVHNSPPPPNNINTAHRGRFQVNVNPIGDSK